MTKGHLITLSDFGSRMVGSPFLWNWTDCFALSVRGLDEMLHQRDYAERFIDAWQDEATARVFLEGFDVFEYFAERGHVVDARFLQPGDVIAAQGEDGLPRVALVLGRHVLASAPTHGVIMLPQRHMTGGPWRAWRFV